MANLFFGKSLMTSESLQRRSAALDCVEFGKPSKLVLSLPQSMASARKVFSLVISDQSLKEATGMRVMQVC